MASQAIIVGSRMRFTYPFHGTPDGYPQYTAHSGQVVTVVRQLTPDESDFYANSYVIRADDEWLGTAWRDELSED